MLPALASTFREAQRSIKLGLDNRFSTPYNDNWTLENEKCQM
jgi:hypothetical protein